MTELSKEILEKHQMRKTRRQKTAFIGLLKEKIDGINIEEGGLFRSRNIVVGDVNSAKVVLGAHYDTCVRLPFPNFLTPKNPLIYILFNILICAGMFTICTLVLFATYLLTWNIDLAGWVFTASAWGLLCLMLFGPANKRNANDNTSGVIELIEIMSSMTDEQKKNVAFVFFDHEESGLLGSALFNRKYKKVMRNKLLINFDCIADGDNIMIIQNKKAKQLYKDATANAFISDNEKHILFEDSSKVIYPSDQARFSCNIGIAAFKKSKLFGLYINKIHTKKDICFDEKNIECIRRGTIGLIDAITAQTDAVQEV